MTKISRILHSLYAYDRAEEEDHEGQGSREEISDLRQETCLARERIVLFSIELRVAESRMTSNGNL